MELENDFKPPPLLRIEKPMDPIKSQLEINLQEAKQDKLDAIRKLESANKLELEEERRTKSEL